MMITDNRVTTGKFLVIFIVGAFMAHMSWLKTPDILVDFGRELYIPWQISEGKLLYRDLIYWNGPISPYLNAFVFKLFGASVHSLLSFNILVIAVITFLITRLFSDKGDLFSGPLAAITFLTLFAFAQYYRIGSYNFAAPYSHELTHGILISFLCIYLFRVYLKTHALVYLFLVGLCTGLALLTKVEIFFALSITTFVALILTLWIERPSFERVSGVVIFFVCGALFPLVLSLILLAPEMGLVAAFKGVLGSWFILASTDIGSGLFQKSVMGFDATTYNATRLAVSLVWYLALFVPFIIINVSLRKSSISRKYSSLAAFAIAAIVAYYFLPGIWSEILRPLPVIMAVLWVVFCILFIQNRDDREKSAWIIGELTIITFALLMLMKMILKVHVAHYGFVLAMPATLVLVRALTVYLPLAISGVQGKRGSSYIIRFASIGAVLSVLFFHVLIISEAYDRKDYPVATGRNKMITYGPQTYPYGLAVNRTLLEIEKNTGPEETIVAFPEGATLNFLSKRVNPSGFVNFIPSEVTMFGENNMLEALKKSPPDYILLVHMDTTEYGFRFFGVDYAFEINAWIKENYNPVFLAGALPFRGNKFGILTLKKKT